MPDGTAVLRCRPVASVGTPGTPRRPGYAVRGRTPAATGPRTLPYPRVTS
ncbi:hypothetical protein SCATT_21900 [Streptantibioticus cattleyicolor NRRL 8057 = DSM 46488]|uniref:Uncharacterized protein n=1 Tax=Streptantibioticus cattleyicolor (strain ATCC 35852 / DSM 46488 / JCM 4925 / NBRC 14057 / NRRL 8057) TaxID=1003195 RepID=G8X2C7_STREN|nr:hypothetical protein SCATT_21900 [Streptantibioticus cattleyicolor NRRL 8057 = DSM 46488]